MGICPRCGSFVDEGEPYCPDCSYIFGSGFDSLDNQIEVGDNLVAIGGYEFDRDEVEDVLFQMGYDMNDLELGMIDDDDLEEIIDMLM